MTWTNSDGLFIKFAKEEGQVVKGGTYSTLGPLKCTEVKIDLTDLAAIDTTYIMGSDHNNRGIVIPSGARIEKVEVVAETAATSGGAATLDIGLVRLDRTTAIDLDGVVAALALASINADGELNTLSVGVTSAGALVGTTTANAGILVAEVNTAVYTAGKVAVRVYWYNPQTDG